MADTIEIELIPFSSIKADWLFWRGQYPLMEKLMSKGKQPHILHVDLAIDTSTANTATESTRPTNEVLNFTTPQQIYIRSDAAGDTSKDVDVIGQKADGSFGQFTLTSDDTDGTTAVDCGTWNFIMFPVKNDTWAGNLIIDDDGSSTTVFWTLALGVSGSDGIVVVPDGYKGCLLSGVASLTAAPATAATVMGLAIADSWKDILTTNKGTSQPLGYRYIKDEQSNIDLKHFYRTGVTTTTIDMFIAIWEA